MEQILIKAACYIAIIILGYTLRKTGFFGPEAFGVLSKIVIRITLPFDLEIRQALVILSFSPISTAVPAFTAELKSDVGLSSAINSIAIIISIVIIVALLLVML